MEILNKDYRDILQCLLKEKVDFLIVGAYAMAAYGFPRATKDLDIWIFANPENAERIFRALKKFGAPMEKFELSDFSKEGLVIQIGVSPCRVDILTQIDGVVFEKAFSEKVEVNLDGLKIPIISRKHLLKNKKVSGRPQDLVDITLLKKRR